MSVEPAGKGAKRQERDNGRQDDRTQHMGDQYGEINYPDYAFAAKFREAGIHVIVHVSNQEKSGDAKRRGHHRLVTRPITVADEIETSQQKGDGCRIQSSQNMRKGRNFDHRSGAVIDNFIHDGSIHKNGKTEQDPEDKPLVEFRFLVVSHEWSPGRKN